MWNIKNNIKKQTKLNQFHRQREQSDGCQKMGLWGLGRIDVGIRKYKLVVTKPSQHREYSPKHFNNYVWCQVGTRNIRGKTLKSI